MDIKATAVFVHKHPSFPGVNAAQGKWENMILYDMPDIFENKYKREI